MPRTVGQSFALHSTPRPRQAVQRTVGTGTDADIPLMDAGLDSLAGTELVRLLSESLATTLDSTLLFDCPALRAVVGYLPGLFCVDFLRGDAEGV